MKDFSYITNQHPQYIENLYRDFTNNPGSVDPDLKKFFEGFDFAMANVAAGGSLPASAEKPGGSAATAGSEPTATDWMYDLRAYRLILGYRNKGHLLAKT
ncbi:MAG: hypothetical protein MUF29_08680, partial [Chitinophagaceae bacterium]|nr:hypothetical protein [Chitinophagaceae bacterium]